MNPFAWLDGAILAAHQRIANSVQYRTERTCFWLARIAALAFIIPLLIDCFRMAMSRPKWAHQAVLVAIGCFLTYNLVRVLIIGLERSYRARHRNWFETFWWVRFMFVGFLALCFLQDIQLKIWNLIDFCMLPLGVAIYFASCTPLPPGSKQPEHAVAPPKLIETEPAA